MATFKHFFDYSNEYRDLEQVFSDCQFLHNVITDHINDRKISDELILVIMRNSSKPISIPNLTTELVNFAQNFAVPEMENETTGEEMPEPCQGCAIELSFLRKEVAELRIMVEQLRHEVIKSKKAEFQASEDYHKNDFSIAGKWIVPSRQLQDVASSDDSKKCNAFVKTVFGDGIYAFHSLSGLKGDWKTGMNELIEHLSVARTVATGVAKSIAVSSLRTTIDRHLRNRRDYENIKAKDGPKRSKISP